MYTTKEENLYHGTSPLSWGESELRGQHQSTGWESCRYTWYQGTCRGVKKSHPKTQAVVLWGTNVYLTLWLLFSPLGSNLQAICINLYFLILPGTRPTQTRCNNREYASSWKGCLFGDLQWYPQSRPPGSQWPPKARHKHNYPHFEWSTVRNTSIRGYQRWLLQVNPSSQTFQWPSAAAHCLHELRWPNGWEYSGQSYIHLFHGYVFHSKILALDIDP